MTLGCQYVDHAAANSLANLQRYILEARVEINYIHFHTCLAPEPHIVLGFWLEEALLDRGDYTKGVQPVGTP